MNQYVKRKQDGFVQFNYAHAAKYVMISENMTIRKCDPERNRDFIIAIIYSWRKPENI